MSCISNNDYTNNLKKLEIRKNNYNKTRASIDEH
jgi:hypothetical protein